MNNMSTSPSSEQQQVPSSSPMIAVNVQDVDAADASTEDRTRLAASRRAAGGPSPSSSAALAAGRSAAHTSGSATTTKANDMSSFIAAADSSAAAAATGTSSSSTMHSADTSATAVDAVAAATPSPSLLRPIPWPLSAKQLFYILGTQSIGAAIVDAGANFGVAYAMYHNQYRGPGGSGKQVTMWWFNQNTIAGDLGVTPIIQVGASMLITSTLVHTDLHHHMIAPLPFVYPHVEHMPNPLGFFSSFRRRKEARRRRAGDQLDEKVAATTTTPTTLHIDDAAAREHALLLDLSFAHYYWLMLLRFLFEGTEHNMLLTLRGGFFRGFLWRVGWTALQGVALGIFFGLPLWCLFVVVIGPIYGNRDLGNKWVPQIIKAVYGGVLGLVTNPVIATLALGSQAEHNLVVAKDQVGDVEKGQVKAAQAAATADESMGASAGTSMSDPEELLVPPPKPPTTPQRPTASRARASSTAASSIASSSRRRRPSLTVDASRMNVLRTPTPRETSTFAFAQPEESDLAPPLPLDVMSAPPSTPPPRRPRAFTASSQHSYYSLGGTGGRAQRPRAASRASQTSNFTMAGLAPPSTVVPASPGIGSVSRSRTPVIGVFDASSSSPAMRARAQSDALSTTSSAGGGGSGFLAAPALRSPGLSPPLSSGDASRPGTSGSATTTSGRNRSPLIAPLRLPPATRAAAESDLAAPRESMELRAEKRGEL